MKMMIVGYRIIPDQTFFVQPPVPRNNCPIFFISLLCGLCVSVA